MLGRNTVVTLSRVARASFTEKVTFQQEGREWAVYLGEECPGRGGVTNAKSLRRESA